MMNGPTNESDTLVRRSGRLERGIWAAGGVVVVGLLAEYGPEIRVAFITHQLPKIGTVGGLLVTGGVAAEVILGIFLAKTAKREREIADRTIAEITQRAARGEQAAAEAQLATETLRAENIKLKMAVRPRVLGLWTSEEAKKEQQKSFLNLEKYAGTKAVIQSATGEPEQLAVDIARVLKRAKWEVTTVGPTIPAYKSLVSDGVLIITREKSMFLPGGKGLMDLKEYTFSETSKAARALEEFLLPDLGPPLGPTFWVSVGNRNSRIQIQESIFSIFQKTLCSFLWEEFHAISS